MPKYYENTFGEAGDLTAIPDSAQSDGSVSYAQGFTNDYQLNLDDGPPAKAIPRAQFNQLMFDITSNIQQYQQFSFPEFITALQNGGSNFPYSKFARVRYDAGTGLGTRIYMSLTDNNATLPTNSTTWMLEKGATYTTITASGNFVVPSYVNVIYITAVAGGGGGGGSGGTAVGSSLPVASGGAGGGGAGSGVLCAPISVTAGETLTLVVGTSGAGGTAGTSSTNGGAGGAGTVTQIFRGATSLLLLAGGIGGTGTQFASSFASLQNGPITAGGAGGSLGGGSGGYGAIFKDTGGALNFAIGGFGGSGSNSIISTETTGRNSVENLPGLAGSNAQAFGSGYGAGGGGASGAGSRFGGQSYAGAVGGNGGTGVIIINY